MQECERLARQALDMAQARGGDQVAVKTANGFDFYGGRSRGVERRTKRCVPAWLPPPCVS